MGNILKKGEVTKDKPPKFKYLTEFVTAVTVINFVIGEFSRKDCIG